MHCIPDLLVTTKLLVEGGGGGRPLEHPQAPPVVTPLGFFLRILSYFRAAILVNTGKHL